MAGLSLGALRRWIPAGPRAWLEQAARAPRTPMQRLALRAAGFRADPVPDPPQVPSAGTSVYIAPANYAQQGWAWARALERERADTEAWNTEVRPPGPFGFRADRVVGLGPFHFSQRWQDAEFDAAAARTHVMVEAARSMFGAKFDYDVAAEVRALRDAGVAVAMMSHGTDLRSPSIHRLQTPWSPFHDKVPQIAAMQEGADRTRRIMLASGASLFVPTPELLTDLPGAEWVPIVVEPERWAAVATEPPTRTRPVVVHAPTRGWIKGTDLIEDAVRAMDGTGAIELRMLEGIPSAQMPDVIGSADIVLEQFRLGIYATTAIEAMAAGRVVVGHVTPEVRAHVRRVSGLDLPVVEADPDSLTTVLAALVSDPDRRAEIGMAGQQFARAAHDGRLSAQVLGERWLDQRDPMASR